MRKGSWVAEEGKLGGVWLTFFLGKLLDFILARSKVSVRSFLESSLSFFFSRLRIL